MNISEVTQKHEQAAAHALSLRTKYTQQATREGRQLWPMEVEQINSAIAMANNLQQQLNDARGDANRTAAFDRALGRLSPALTSGNGGGRSGSLGAQFLNSEAYRWLQERRGSLPAGPWTSASSELTFHATLLDESAGSGGPLVIPDHRPGIVSLPQRELVMADLIASGQTDSNTVTYMVQKTATNAADTVAEGAAKPESTLVYEAISDPVRKVATHLPITEEMLEDTPGLQSHINAQLSLFVQLAEDDQLLNGSVVAPDIVGFLARTGLAAAVARGADSNADCVYKQIAAIFTATGHKPTGIVMNPVNWMSIALSKLATGEYISGNGPFAAPQTPTLWGIPVAITPAMVANTALVGAFRTASQIFRKGGLRVEMTNSHASDFIENKIRIRAEERLALAVYRPAAFGICTGLT